MAPSGTLELRPGPDATLTLTAFRPRPAHRPAFRDAAGLTLPASGERVTRVLVVEAPPAPALAHLAERVAAAGGELRTLETGEHWTGLLLTPAGGSSDWTRRLLDPWAREYGLAVGASAPLADARALGQAEKEALGAAGLVARALGQGCRGYEELGPYHWILTMSLSQLWQILLGPELGPVLRLEPAQSAQLLPVLDALLATGGDRMRAASLLELPLPELEARIARLAQRLGTDFLTPARQAILQAAWIAYRLRTDLARTLEEALPASVSA